MQYHREFSFVIIAYEMLDQKLWSCELQIESSDLRGLLALQKEVMHIYAHQGAVFSQRVDSREQWIHIKRPAQTCPALVMPP